MNDIAREIHPVRIEDELRQSYLDYAMSVIVGRALPDVRDGLKPVHRRVLFAMHQLKNDWNKAYKKSARVVGDVIGKYHPHGDDPVYETIVRLAQLFSMRYPLIDGQGNFGSVDGDAPAAMRYTEVRMMRLAHQLLDDLEKETVDFVPNYDGSEQMPAVLPTRVPNLLVNGSTGIAVGMATNIPPHNLAEVIDATLALLDNPEITLDALMQILPGPDFPTGGLINGRAGIVQAYRSGRGRVVLRGKYHLEEMPQERTRIVFDEIPYQVNKARLIEKIAALVKEKMVTGISELRDESDKEGIRIVIELRRHEAAEIVVNNLFEHTALQNTFGVNMVALVNGRPRLLTLQEILASFLSHRRDVITRRTIYELRRARSEGHLLEGLAIALASVDEIIEAIKTAPSVQIARERLVQRDWPATTVLPLIERLGPSDVCRPQNLDSGYGFQRVEDQDVYRFSPAQVQAILDLRLQKLTALEQEKLLEQYRVMITTIADLLDILQNPDRLTSVVREELVSIRDQYRDARRSEIFDLQEDLQIADLIPPEDMVFTLSKAGYAKIQPLGDYRVQHRGGKGKQASNLKDEDYIQRAITTHTHDTLLCFSNLGKVYWLKAFQLPQGSRNARGRPLINILPLSGDEQITEILPLPGSREHDLKSYDYSDTHWVCMATSQGIVKKTGLQHFSRPRTNGIIAIDLQENETLIGAALTDGTQQIMLFSSGGKVIRFAESDVRDMGRTARGVIGMRMDNDEKIVAMLLAQGDAEILTASACGFGKRTPIDQFRLQNRGGRGVIAMQCDERNGALIGALSLTVNDELMLISDSGTLARIRAGDIRRTARNTKGVTLIRLGAGEKLVSVDRIVETEADEENASDTVEESSENK